MARAQKRLKEMKEEPSFEEGAVSEESTENELDAEELNRRIAEAAYYIAEKRGFAPGNEQADWLKAEQEVISQLPG